jgi:hypothetical protein
MHVCALDEQSTDRQTARQPDRQSTDTENDAVKTVQTHISPNRHQRPFCKFGIHLLRMYTQASKNISSGRRSHARTSVADDPSASVVKQRYRQCHSPFADASMCACVLHTRIVRTHVCASNERTDSQTDRHTDR